MKIENLRIPETKSSSFSHEPRISFDNDFSFYRKLGRTDLNVSCLGIGGGGNISSEDTLYAFSRGINFFFFSSDLHHYMYSSMSSALRTLCGRGSTQREKVILATVTYMKGNEITVAALMDQFMELGIDYIDIFFWGWIGRNDRAFFNESMDTSRDLRGPNSLYHRTIEKMVGATELMKKMGVVRYVGASFHDLGIAREWLDSPLLDVVMIRHNIAHRSAQNLVLPYLNTEDLNRPGIMTFKSAGMFGLLTDVPPDLPKDCWQPSVPDLYRYSLSQNCVDIALMGSRNRSEVNAALEGLKKGRLTEREIDYLNLYGDLHRNRLPSKDIPVERLIYM
jgi:predicted aldo/keto reductase-like oxidoreductase